PSVRPGRIGGLHRAASKGPPRARLSHLELEKCPTNVRRIALDASRTERTARPRRVDDKAPCSARTIPVEPPTNRLDEPAARILTTSAAEEATPNHRGAAPLKAENADRRARA